MIPLGRLSIFIKIVDPVAVNPEIDSKMQSIMLLKQPEKKNGNAPKNDKVSHEIAAAAKASVTSTPLNGPVRNTCLVFISFPPRCSLADYVNPCL